MSDSFENRLRDHFAERARRVQVEPDAEQFVEHSVGHSHRQGALAGWAVALTVVVAGAGVITGANLVSAGSTDRPQATAPSTTAPSRVGASLAPNATGGPTLPPVANQNPYRFLFSRVSSSGVTVRAYSAGSSTAGACTQAVSCAPTGSVPGGMPCPQGAMCVRPLVQPSPSQPTGSGSSGGAATNAVPPQSTSNCDQLVVELSTDKAVGIGSVPEPTTAPSPNTLEVLGSGTFGSAEADPVDWVAVWVGSGTVTVRLMVGGSAVDAMPPNSGIVVLTVGGSPGLAGATVVGVDPSGASVATAPADQVVVPDATSCPVPPTDPSSTTTTTVPGGPVPATTTTTTSATAPPDPTPAPMMPAVRSPKS
jgi:hypothetical protein